MIIKINTSLEKANKAKAKIIKNFSNEDWFVAAEIKNDNDFGYFLNVQAETASFEIAKEVLPLYENDAIVFVEAV